MRNLFTGLLLLILAALLALAIREDSGYVLISYRGWTLESTLALLVAATVLLFILLYWLIRAFSNLRSLPGGITKWVTQRDTRRSRNALTQGLIELAEGEWQKAEKQLTRYAKESETPLLNYLSAARAAQQQGKYKERDHYLQLAHESTPSADVAVGLTQADLQLARQQHEQALATLQRLREIAPRHTHVLSRLKELYIELEDWSKLQTLLPELRRRKVINDQEFDQLGLKVYRYLLKEAAKHPKNTDLTQIWAGIPKRFRGSETLIVDYAEYLLQQDKEEIAEPLIRDALTRYWSSTLLTLYGRIVPNEQNKALHHAEEWLEKHPKDPTLLLVLGRMCVQNQLWGKARSYLDASIGIAPNVETYHALGKLQEQMGEIDAARNSYREGLTQLINDSEVAG